VVEVPGLEGLIADFRARKPRALARAITLAESGRGADVIRSAGALMGGGAQTLGLTGPPGVGKSTLCAALVAQARAGGKRVGVISVDPSSPFSHGALLGDRIRLAEHFTDPGVFIRSMASRGHLGGVAGATADTIALMDAFGKDVVVVETVGVGQSEIEIAALTDTTVVVLQPGAGDSVQLLKAGILEVADVFVVNKADHPLAQHLDREIRALMSLLEFPGWIPLLVTTQATEGKGIDELWRAIARHADYLRSSGELARRRERAFDHRVRQLVLGRLERRVDLLLRGRRESRRASADPYASAEEVVAALREGGVP
jgi:LAO/AO transport system kinase